METTQITTLSNQNCSSLSKGHILREKHFFVKLWHLLDKRANLDLRSTNLFSAKSKFQKTIFRSRNFQFLIQFLSKVSLAFQVENMKVKILENSRDCIKRIKLRHFGKLSFTYTGKLSTSCTTARVLRQLYILRQFCRNV